MQNLDEYRRIKASSIGAEGIMDSDFEHMMETTNEQFKLLKINMKELVFPYLHKPIELLNKALTGINKNPLLQKGLFGAIIGTIGLGVVLSALGTTAILISKIVSGYGNFLSYARDLTPVLIKNSAKLLEFVGLNSTAHNLTFKTKILKNGDKLGLASAFSVKGGFIADIRRIDNNLRETLLKTFREFPSTITKSTLALKDWTVTSVKSIPSNFIAGLNNLKTGLLGIPNLIKTAIVSFRAFSVTLLTSPLGWIALAIGAVALVIYKYWKPITGFFKGLWQGLKEGLQPLMPLFKQISNSLSPIIKPIKAIIDWIKKLIKPVEDTGGAAEKMGVRFGKTIANIIVSFAKLVAKAFEVGRKITDMLVGGMLSGITKVKDGIGKITQIIRDHLPHSPAKTGPLKDLHKVKIVETIADTIKPLPITKAMNKTLGVFNGGFKGSNKGGSSIGGSVVINYNPTISISGSNGSKDDFLAMLKKHKEDILTMVRKENERKMRLAY